MRRGSGAFFKMIEYEGITTIKQCKDLKELATRISLEHFAPITGTGQVYYMMDKFLSPEVVMREIAENYEFAFVLYDGKRAGYYSIAFEGDALFLSKLYTDKAFRGMGLGHAMFERIKEKAKKAGCKYIYLTVNKHNSSSVAIYKKWNFYISDCAETDIGGGYIMDDYIMRYDL